MTVAAEGLMHRKAQRVSGMAHARIGLRKWDAPF